MDNKQEELYDIAKQLIDKSLYSTNELVADYIKDNVQKKVKSYQLGWLSARGLTNGHIIFPYLQYMHELFSAGSEMYKKKRK